MKLIVETGVETKWSWRRSKEDRTVEPELQGGESARWWWKQQKLEHHDAFDDDKLRALSSEQPPKRFKEATPSLKKTAT
jgi:hypothetical protein